MSVEVQLDQFGRPTVTDRGKGVVQIEIGNGEVGPTTRKASRHVSLQVGSPGVAGFFQAQLQDLHEKAQNLQKLINSHYRHDPKTGKRYLPDEYKDNVRRLELQIEQWKETARIQQERGQALVNEEHARRQQQGISEDIQRSLAVQEEQVAARESAELDRRRNLSLTGRTGLSIGQK